MTYDSLDIIPAKLYNRIEMTGDVRLLTDDPKVPTYFLEELWSILEKEDLRISSDKEVGKTLDISRRVEELNSQLEGVTLAVHVLKSVVDWDLIDKLKEYHYDFKFESIEDKRRSRLQYKKDLEKIERHANTMEVRIGRLRSKLPKKDDDGDSVTVTTFDETILSYSAVVGTGLVDTNAITRTQYHALIKTGNQKMKALTTNMNNKKSRNGKR